MTPPTIHYAHKRFHLTFPYDPLLVAEVKALPDRWYDPKTRTWVCGYSDDLKALCWRWEVAGWASAYEEFVWAGDKYRYVKGLDESFAHAIAKED